jgi:hypothetical protein
MSDKILVTDWVSNSKFQALKAVRRGGEARHALITSSSVYLSGCCISTLLILCEPEAS